MAFDGKMKVVYVITKRGEKSFWNRIGVGYVNQDGSINLKLESLPVNGECQVRNYEPKEDREDDRDSRDSKRQR